ncbi:MAG: hypothetical protein DSY37_03790 [Hyperthermus sp.]|nr:MAG: hypothetical protein DSY37_03790 [Hyperthermus sp.]
MNTRLCLANELAKIGLAARKVAPPVVTASSIGSWHWCPLKAWHTTSLFNAGWLEPRSLTAELLDGLALLWATELSKRYMYRIIHGHILHGDHIEPGETITAAKLVAELAKSKGEALLTLLEKKVINSPGLIDREAFERQLQRYMTSDDIVEYSRREEWPMIARRTRQGFYIIGVPDRVEWSSGGIRIVELKTTSKPWMMKKRGRSYWAAKTQLATYAWIMHEKWPLEEAILLVEDNAGRIVMREKHDPLELVEWFEENAMEIAAELASTKPPLKPRKAPCKSCEYTIVEASWRHQ